MLTGTTVVERIAFADVADVRERTAVQFRIGPAQQHRDYTFGELQELVARRAASLAAAGCRSGERLALLMPHGERLVTTFFSALYSGLVPSIIAWPTTKMDADKYRRNVLAVVKGLAADWVVTDAATAATLGEAIGGARIVDPGSIDETTSILPPQPRGEGLAFIQFSGGTTGTQKSVPISYALLARQLEAYAGTLRIVPADHIISWLPLYHDMGLVACLLLPFVCRIPVTLFAPMEWVMDPRPFLHAISSERATLCWLPNFAFSFLANRARVEPDTDLSSLRAVINCSEPVRVESMDRFCDRFAPHGLRPDSLHTCYAMAETTFAVTQTTVSDPPRRLRISRAELGCGRIVVQEHSPHSIASCGTPIPGMAVRIVDEQGAERASGDIGEIWLRGTSVMDHYLDAPGRPHRDAVFTDGWYRTGDLGAVLDGHLYITGRKKDVVIVGGVNIYPEDLEAAVSEIPGIHAGRVVALGIDSEENGTEQLVLVAEADSAEQAGAGVLEAEVRRTVAGLCGVAPFRVFIVPPRWIVKSTAGKISRRETAARVRERRDALERGEYIDATGEQRP